jgi:hypothetical protein
MIRASCLRFLFVVSPSATWTHAAFAASVLIGAATVWVNPQGVDSAFGGILVLQMFAASSGFTSSASRGYFDPLLTGGRSRLRIAVASLAASTLPGVAAWVITAIIAAALGRAATALAPHRFVALILVSTICWAGGLALPRMAPGVLWAFVLVVLALSRGIFGQYLVLAQSQPDDVLQVIASAVAFAVCPFLLLGDLSAASHGLVLGIDVVLALVAVGLGCSYLAGREYSLVEPV